MCVNWWAQSKARGFAVRLVCIWQKDGQPFDRPKYSFETSPTMIDWIQNWCFSLRGSMYLFLFDLVWLLVCRFKWQKKINVMTSTKIWPSIAVLVYSSHKDSLQCLIGSMNSCAIFNLNIQLANNIQKYSPKSDCSSNITRAYSFKMADSFWLT